jgi:hypothetical protein
MVALYHDDGYFLSLVQLVHAGREPYRDFVFPGPPALLYLYAAVVHLPISSYLASRVTTALGVLVGCWLLWAIARRYCSPPAASAAVAVWGVWMATTFQYDPYHHWGYTMALAMAWALHRGAGSQHSVAWAAVAGVFGALAVLTIQVMAPAVIAGLIVCQIGARRAWRPLIAMIGAGLAAAVVTVAALAAAGLLTGFWQQAVVYALFGFRPRNELPWPWDPTRLVDLKALLEAPGLYLFIWGRLLIWSVGFAVPLATLAVMLIGWLRGRLSLDAPILSTWTVAFFICAVAYGRLTGPLLWMSAGFACVLVARFLDRRLRAQPSGRHRLVALVSALAALAFSLEPVSAGLRTTCAGGWTRVGMRDATVCVPDEQAADFQGAQDFVQAHPRDSIAFLSVSTTLYPLTRTTAPIGSIYATPLNSREDTERTERELDAARVRYIVYHPRLIWETVPSTQASPDGRWLLEDYLDRNYQVIGQAGRMTVYERR